MVRDVAAFADVAALSLRAFLAETMPRGPMGSIDAKEDWGRHERDDPRLIQANQGASFIEMFA